MCRGGTTRTWRRVPPPVVGPRAPDAGQHGGVSAEGRDQVQPGNGVRDSPRPPTVPARCPAAGGVPGRKVEPSRKRHAALTPRRRPPSLTLPPRPPPPPLLLPPPGRPAALRMAVRRSVTGTWKLANAQFARTLVSAGFVAILLESGSRGERGVKAEEQTDGPLPQREGALVWLLWSARGNRMALGVF